MRLIAICLLCLPAWLQAEVSSSQLKLFNDAEISRGVLARSGIQWTVKATSETPRSTGDATLIVKAQRGSALAEIIAPDTSAGKKYLLTGGNMYFYKPGTKRAVAVPKRQQLAGDAAIGDIASTGFLAEYEPVAAEPDILNDEPCTRFTIEARSGATATYARIVLWASDRDRVFRKAEFYTRTGRLIRAAYFQHKSSISVEGSSYRLISRLDVDELLGLPQRTTLIFTNCSIENFPASLFDKDALGGES